MPDSKVPWPHPLYVPMPDYNLPWPPLIGPYARL